MPNITKERLRHLEDDAEILAALHAGGVDNWDWYEASLEPLAKKAQKREAFENLVEEMCEALCEGIEEPAGRGCGFGFLEDATEAAADILQKFIEGQVPADK